MTAVSENREVVATQERFHNIEFLRFVFSVTIVYFHILHSNIMGLIGENNAYVTLQELSNNAGWIVECFFIISGYFLFASFHKQPELPFTMFALKKVFRLGPVLIFSILTCIVFFGQRLIPSLFNSLFLQCIGLSLEYKGINWYISPLFWASLFYYAVIKVLEPKKANVLIAVIVYFSYLVNISSCNGGFGRETVYGIVNLGLTRALAGIGLGYLIGVGIETFQTIGFNYKNKHTKRGKIAVLTMVELIICIFFVYYFLLGGQYQNKFIVVILFSVLLFSFLLRGGMVSRELNRPVFSLLGKYAYSIYVMQQISFWILQKTLWRTNIVGRVGLCICVSLLFSILVGVITYYMIECPFSKLYLNFYIRKD